MDIFSLCLEFLAKIVWAIIDTALWGFVRQKIVVDQFKGDQYNSSMMKPVLNLWLERNDGASSFYREWRIYLEQVVIVEGSFRVN